VAAVAAVAVEEEAVVVEEEAGDKTALTKQH
jgi:hypothetical protein